MSSAVLRAQVAGSYRHMLRTINSVFAGDVQGLRTGWAHARQAFRANASVSDPEAIAKLVAEARDAAEFLRDHIVQAKTNTAGRFELKVKDVTAADDASIVVQTPSESLAKPKDGCCGGGCH